MFLKIKKMFVNELKDTGIIWCTGDYSYNRFVNEIHDLNGDGSIFISSFLEDVGLAYKASDIAISRAGAGVIMEFAAVGLPSILIPYPYAAANHQDKNADMFDRAGAAIKVGESDASPENVGKILIDLLDNPSELARMANKASHISKINASNDIVDSIIQDISSLDDSL